MAYSYCDYISNIATEKFWCAPFTFHPLCAATEKRIEERKLDLQTVLSGKKAKLIKVNSEGRFAPCSRKKFASEIEDMVEAVDMRSGHP